MSTPSNPSPLSKICLSCKYWSRVDMCGTTGRTCPIVDGRRRGGRYVVSIILTGLVPNRRFGLETHEHHDKLTIIER